MFELEKQIIRSQFPGNESLHLHEPSLSIDEEQAVLDCVRSGFVSYVGEYTTRFEKMLQDFTESKHVIVMSSGTAALHIALKTCGVETNSEVITQALSFVGTANAILYCNASPVFIDVDTTTIGMSPDALKNFLDKNVTYSQVEKCSFNKRTGKKITACLPMHTFGIPCDVEHIIEICTAFGIAVIEDAAESLGSFAGANHTGTLGKAGILSFNGNKTITTGGGGAMLTNDSNIAARAKHLSTTAKKAHPWAFIHDELGYNYRLSSINAALGCSQLKRISRLLDSKRDLASRYQQAFIKSENSKFFAPPIFKKANHWLNTIQLPQNLRDSFIEYMHAHDIYVRPVWNLLPTLSFLNKFQCESIPNAEKFSKELVNIPSSAGVKS